MARKLRTEAEEACKVIIGLDVYNGMRRGGMPLPAIMDAAIFNAFKRGATGPSVEKLREAYTVLSDTGVLTDEED